MTGWRIGFITGNARLISAFATVKDNSDSGQFIPIQKAAAYALAHTEITIETAEKYSRRHDQLSSILQDSGLDAIKPKGSFFLYVKAPAGVENGPTFMNAEAFSHYLIQEHSISTVPWDDSGSYVRFSVTFEADGPEEEHMILDEIRDRLQSCKFVF